MIDAIAPLACSRFCWTSTCRNEIPLMESLNQKPTPGTSEASIRWQSTTQHTEQIGLGQILRVVYKAQIFQGTDILHLGALGNSLVILNKYEVAKELLEQRAGIYSDRPSSTMFTISGFTNVLSMVPYGDLWRVSRRMFHSYFGLGVKEMDRRRELFYARRLLKQLLDKPDDSLDHVLHLVGSIAISTAYGLQAQAQNDPNLHTSEKLVKKIADIIGRGMFLVDVLPFLRYVPEWVPGASFQTLARESRDLSVLFRNRTFDRALDAMKSESYLPSLVSQQLHELELESKDKADIEILKDVAYTVYLGASDTLWSTLGTFLLAMVCYPEVQEKARQELDAVLDGRLPEHDDLDQLPYLKAILFETMRWKPAFPIGIPHASTLDDVYNGMFIPKGSVVIPNAWAMLGDPEVYPNPTEFIPERFYKDGKIDESVRSPLDIAFGFGRRHCPGRYVAQSTFMITAASVLSTFDLLMKVDEKGEVIRPKQEYHESTIFHPKPFSCRIIPRSSHTKQLVETWAAAEGDSPP